MEVIDTNTVVINSSDELKSVLEGDNLYNYIYFGNDITLSSGILINSNKTSITIDGTYNNVRHKYIDMKSTSYTNTIRANSTNNLIVVKNMDITGNNYYGVIYVLEDNKYKSVVVEYNNVTYTGVQMCFHPIGLTRFIDVTVTVETGYTTGNEIAECNSIEIGGNSKFIHRSTANSSFWFRNTNPSLKILSNSNVYFESISRELLYGTTELEFVVEKNTLFNISAHSGFGYGTYGTKNTLIDENAKLVIKQTTSNGSYATWYSYGSITVNKNATLEIINNYSGITRNNYNIYFSNSSGGLYLNEPNEIILFNSVGNTIYSSNNIPFKFEFSRINLSNNLNSVDSDNVESTLPYSWYKKNNLSSISGNFSNSKTTIVSSNYDEEELASLPSLDLFIICSYRLLSIGSIIFHLNPITDLDTSIVGDANVLSSILIKYDDVSDVFSTLDSGEFTYSLSNTLSIGTVVTFNVKEKSKPIYYTKEVTVVYSGEIIIDSVTKVISFDLDPFKISPLLCPRNEILEIDVYDSRINSSDWKLYVNIDHDLTSLDGDVLMNSLVYIDGSNVIPLSTERTLIYNGVSNGGVPVTTKVSFLKNEGIVLCVNNPIKNKIKYSTTLTFSVE